jgi:uncharacterized ion transporter superfamily protein YfcC
MNFDLQLLTENSIVIVPIVLALVEAVKLTGWVKDHFAPLVSIAMGIIVGFLVNHNQLDLTATFLSGAIYGLMASGLYSGVKTTMVAHARLKVERKAEKQNKNDNQ